MSKFLVITGGSRGIGKQTIRCFQAEGYIAINLSRSPCSLDGVINLSLDLGDWQNVTKISEELQALIKGNTSLCLVHNAAYYKRDKVESLSPPTLALALEINVISAAALNTHLIPHMPPGSSIIYIGSTLAEKAVPCSASYVISKHAVIGLMRATCQDLMGKHIHTCCICPGLVDTELLHDTMEASLINHLVTNKVIGRRLIAPEEIAKTIYFCASGAVINGTVLHANLGQVAD